MSSFARARERLQALPLFMCGFRPFFLLAAAAAVAGMVLLLGAWSGLLPVPAALPGGLVTWHAHELIYGFGMAGVTGFLLTAVPEFTGSAPFTPRVTLTLVALWLAARLSWLAASLLPALLLPFNLALDGALLALVAPRLWRDPLRRHLGFAVALALLTLLHAGFFAALLGGGRPLAWLHAAVGAMACLVIVATSRISMSVVNGLMEAGRPGAPPPQAVYLARPPRRHLAVLAIALCGLSEFAGGPVQVTGWLALAAAAAMLHLLNDWHIGRALFTRWALMLYGSYWLIALGYAALGAAWLDAPLQASAGWHLLTAGAMGLSMFAVMSMAGRIHAGLWLDRRRWLPAAAAAIVLAALLRAAAGLSGAPQWPLLAVAGLLWAGAFAAYLWHAAPVLLAARSDGQGGCAEPAMEDEHAHRGCA